MNLKDRLEGFNTRDVIALTSECIRYAGGFISDYTVKYLNKTDHYIVYKTSEKTYLINIHNASTPTEALHQLEDIGDFDTTHYSKFKDLHTILNKLASVYGNDAEKFRVDMIKNIQFLFNLKDETLHTYSIQKTSQL